MTNPGRPSKLNTETKERFLKALRTGAHMQTACLAAGVDVSTVSEWIRRGQGRDRRSCTPEYAEFAASVTRAIADSEMILLTLISNASRTDARHAQWLLERRFPERWANTHRVRVQVDQQVESELNLLFEAIASAPDLTSETKRRIFEIASQLESRASMAGCN
jgi:hypothetical protein